MAISKLLVGACAAAFALAASSCCNTVSNDCGKNANAWGGETDCSENCKVWPHIQDHAEYGNPCQPE